MTPRLNPFYPARMQTTIKVDKKNPWKWLKTKKDSDIMKLSSGPDIFWIAVCLDPVLTK